MTRKLATVRVFAPEQWGQVHAFSQLYSGTYRFTARQQRALAGVGLHFEKAFAFYDLACKFRPSLDVDRAELNDRGFTPAVNHREVALVIEAAILELYSSIDCTAKVLHAIYGSTSRGYRDSTRYLFSSYERITGSFPSEIREILRSATWYSDLRSLRDELTHGGTGSCHMEQAGGPVTYMHTGIIFDGRPLIVDDVFGWLTSCLDVVNRFLGLVFKYLRGTLGSTRVVVVCGLANGRIYQRDVDPTENLTIHSGICASRHWFDQQDAPKCPFSEECGAYLRAKEMNPATAEESSESAN